MPQLLGWIRFENRAQDDVVAVLGHGRHEQLPVRAVDDADAPRQGRLLERELHESTFRGHREHAQERAFPAVVVDGPRHHRLAVHHELGGEEVAVRAFELVALEELVDPIIAIDDAHLGAAEVDLGPAIQVPDMGKGGGDGAGGGGVVPDPGGDEGHDFHPADCGFCARRPSRSVIILALIQDFV